MGDNIELANVKLKEYGCPNPNPFDGLFLSQIQSFKAGTDRNTREPIKVSCIVCPVQCLCTWAGTRDFQWCGIDLVAY